MIQTENGSGSRTAILVCSCDKYQDAWVPFFTLLRRYWPDCPYPVYLLSNTIGYDGHGVINVLIGEDNDWTSNFQLALSRIEGDRFLIFMEDYFLTKPVDTVGVRNLIDAMAENCWDYLRLFPVPGVEKAELSIGGIGVGPIEKGAPYRVSLQLAVWTRALLNDLLLTGESAWQLELVGSRRSDGLPELFYSVVDGTHDRVPIHYYCTGIVKGRWIPGALRLLKAEGIAVDRSRRAVQRPWHKAYRWARYWGGRLIRSLGARR